MRTSMQDCLRSCLPYQACLLTLTLLLSIARQGLDPSLTPAKVYIIDQCRIGSREPIVNFSPDPSHRVSNWKTSVRDQDPVELWKVINLMLTNTPYGTSSPFSDKQNNDLRPGETLINMILQFTKAIRAMQSLAVSKTLESDQVTDFILGHRSVLPPLKRVSTMAGSINPWSESLNPTVFDSMSHPRIEPRDALNVFNGNHHLTTPQNEFSCP